MKIVGTGSEIPKKIVTNDMLSEFLDTSDAWIYPRTGIKFRHVISDEKLEDLAISAARKALDDAGMTAADIDYIICSVSDASSREVLEPPARQSTSTAHAQDSYMHLT